jgi:hypothetical protein
MNPNKYEKLQQHTYNITYRVDEIAQRAKRAKRDWDKYAGIQRLKTEMAAIRLFLDGIDHEIAERAKTVAL